MTESSLTEAVRFSVEGKARPKGRPRSSSRHGVNRHYTPKTTVDYERAIREAAVVALGDRPRFEGPVSVLIKIRCQPPKRTSKAVLADMLAAIRLPTSRPDIDNVQKAVADAISGVLIRDDADIVDLGGRKPYALTAGIDIVVATAISGPAAAFSEL